MFRNATLFLLFVAAAEGAFATEVQVTGPAGRTPWYEERVPVHLEEVRRALRAEAPPAIHVVLATDDREFARETGAPPEWAAAVALPARGTLVVRLSALGPATGLDAASILRHELVHLLLPRRVGDRDVPRWFEEGLAQVVGGRILRTDLARLPLAAATGRLLPLASITDQFPQEEGNAALAYAQGESVVEYLLEEEGEAGLHDLFDRMAAGAEFPAALSAVYDVDSAGLEADWREWLAGEGDPWWIALLSASTIPFLLFLAALLLVGAWRRARRRGREIYADLPE